MKQGKVIAIVSDKDTSPLKSPNTKMIAAALAADCRFASDKALIDTIEDKGDGKTERTVTWCMDGTHKAHFAPNFAEEHITFGEFRKRFESLEWCEANPFHPIAYLRSYSDKLNRLRDRVVQMKPLVLIRKGGRTALIPADCPAARKAEILARL